MKASRFSDAQKAFILKQGADMLQDALRRKLFAWCLEEEFFEAPSTIVLCAGPSALSGRAS